MDDLELNGTGYPTDEPAKEPEQTTQIPEQPPVQTPPSGFYAWSGAPQPQQPQQQEMPRQKESPFANSPYVRVAPQQPSVQPPQPPVPPQPVQRPTPPQPPVPPQAAQRPTPPQPPVSPQATQRPTPPRPPRQKKSPLPVIAIITCVVVLVAVLVSALAVGGKFKAYEDRLSAYAQQIDQLEDKLSAANRPQSGGSEQSTATNDVPVRLPSAEGVMTPAQVYARCVPSVVAIHCTGTAGNGFGQLYETASSGSGFVLSADGYIVTNYHVVENSKSIEISMYDGTTYKAEYIGGNEANDIALIKVDAQNLPPVTIGSSSDLIVGDQVAAIGNPLGELASTLTVGYVSAKDRIVTSEGTQINMLQTDAAINPGNSGGPLFNMYGEVVGITSAKYSGTTDSGATIEGIGFAIPTDDVMMMLEDLRTFGYITGGYLGVTVSEVSQEASDLYGLPQGVLVRDVMPGSCAEKAGMRSQDIIVDLGGNEVKNLNGLSRALNKCKAGQEVVVTVYRSGKEVELTVVLDERPQGEEPEVTEPAPTEQYTPWPGNGFMDDWFGQFFG